MLTTSLFHLFKHQLKLFLMIAQIGCSIPRVSAQSPWQWCPTLFLMYLQNRLHLFILVNSPKIQLQMFLYQTICISKARLKLLNLKNYLDCKWGNNLTLSESDNLICFPLSSQFSLISFWQVIQKFLPFLNGLR